SRTPLHQAWRTCTVISTCLALTTGTPGPSVNSSEPVVMYMNVSLTQIMDVDEKNQLIKLNMWIVQEWKDPFFEWNPAEYGDADHMLLPPDALTGGDWDLSQSATKLKVYHDGRVVWKPPVIYESSCDINVEFFPFDTQVADYGSSGSSRARRSFSCRFWAGPIVLAVRDPGLIHSSPELPFQKELRWCPAVVKCGCSVMPSSMAILNDFTSRSTSPLVWRILFAMQKSLNPWLINASPLSDTSSLGSPNCAKNARSLRNIHHPFLAWVQAKFIRDMPKCYTCSSRRAPLLETVRSGLNSGHQRQLIILSSAVADPDLGCSLDLYRFAHPGVLVSAEVGRAASTSTPVLYEADAGTGVQLYVEELVIDQQAYADLRNPPVAASSSSALFHLPSYLIWTRPLTVAQLHAACLRDNGLPVLGNKQELIERLQAAPPQPDNAEASDDTEGEGADAAISQLLNEEESENIDAANISQESRLDSDFVELKKREVQPRQEIGLHAAATAGDVDPISALFGSLSAETRPARHPRSADRKLQGW
uniref:Neur_chan_LBD domain-containing protein n=1 Tax=Macrostomum lignano TaxID=282301 RepID=A0A1I8F1J7_9PLAT